MEVAAVQPFRRLASALMNGQPVVVPSAEDLPEEWRSEREALAAMGVRSLVGLPAVVAGETVAALSLAQLDRRRDWSSETVDQMLLFGETIAGGLARRRLSARSSDVLSFGPFRLHGRERRLERDGRIVKIGSRALDILVALTERAGEVVSNEELALLVWPDTAVETSAVRVQIAGLRKALGEGRTALRYVSNVPGRGYSFVAEVARPAASTPRRAQQPPTRGEGPKLPPRLARIIGRDETIRDVSQQLLASRFLTIVGTGGLGKTTVAIAVCHGLVPRFGRDACFVDLGETTDRRDVPTMVASSLGLVTRTEDAAATLAAFLRDRRTLLVLDTCEHVVDTIAPLAERVSREAPGLHILATSREPIRVHGEHVYRLPALECPPEHGLSGSDALAYPAVQLFLERASASGARITLTDDDAQVVAAICRRLDGNVLAIEVAAGRVATYGVRGTASLLEDRFGLLWLGRRTAPPRHQTLSASLDWSYDLLTDVEKRALRALSGFTGFFSLDEAADAVDMNVGQTAEVVWSLVEKSLVSSHPRDGHGPQFRLMGMVRGYAFAKLEEARVTT
jgi:predicted ATPase/DNA-binding winged helix-turn-helix (wHTH) protein